MWHTVFQPFHGRWHSGAGLIKGVGTVWWVWCLKNSDDVSPEQCARFAVSDTLMPCTDKSGTGWSGLYSPHQRTNQQQGQALCCADHPSSSSSSVATASITLSLLQV